MTVRTVQEVEALLSEWNDRSNPILKDLYQDERKGVASALARWEKRIAHEQKVMERFIEMQVYENKYRNQGFSLIAGIDEVGRGPLAGPVVAAAVILPENFILPGIDDSKKLSENKRDEYYELIQEKALDVSLGIIEPNIIDAINIYEATKKAMNLAVSSLKDRPEVLLIDAMKLNTPFLEESIIKGDSKSISIAAASIVAKVTRDSIMKKYALQYPEYHFDQNMGYGTKEHLEALQLYGVTPIHRRSFAPIKDMNVLVEK
jgi:ribonuclease HII